MRMKLNERMKRYYATENGKQKIYEATRRSIKKKLWDKNVHYDNFWINEGCYSEMEIQLLICHNLIKKGIKFRCGVNTSFGRPDIIIYKDKIPKMIVEVKSTKAFFNNSFNLRQKERYSSSWLDIIYITGMEEAEKFSQSIEP